MEHRESRTIRLLDTTLRDGNQAPGVSMGMKNRLVLAGRLFAAGIDEIEAGIPASGLMDQNIIRLLSESFPQKRVIAWCRLKSFDIEAAYGCGARSVHICLPFSGYHLKATSHTWEDVLEKTMDLVGRYRSRFSFMSLGLQDAFRADERHIGEVNRLLDELPIDRIRISDTVGTAMPEEVSRTVRLFTGRSGVPVEFHGHNDYGLVTANCLAAIDAGADTIDVTVNGIGERAGNAPLAEVVMNIDRKAGYHTHVDPSMLYALSTFAEQVSGRVTPEDKPFVGGAVFTHTSGIHLHGLRSDPLAYQPLLPYQVGRSS